MQNLMHTCTGKHQTSASVEWAVYSVPGLQMVTPFTSLF